MYSLGGTICNKIFNYKETALEIGVNDLETYGTRIDNCEECQQSLFCDNVHNHVLTGDLRTIENEKLRKLICCGPSRDW